MTFQDIIVKICGERGGQARVSEQTKIHQGRLSELRSGKRRPTPDLCDQLANGDERLSARLHKLGARAVGWRV